MCICNSAEVIYRDILTLSKALSISIYCYCSQNSSKRTPNPQFYHFGD